MNYVVVSMLALCKKFELCFRFLEGFGYKFLKRKVYLIFFVLASKGIPKEVLQKELTRSVFGERRGKGGVMLLPDDEQAPRGAYALVGCRVAPDFEFEDVELARGADLIANFSERENLIKTLTRQA